MSELFDPEPETEADLEGVRQAAQGSNEDREFDVVVHRMTRLASWLWVDLSEVVWVKLADGRAYSRLVVIGLRNGVEHSLVVHRNPSGRGTVGQGNEAVDKWLRKHLGEFLGLPAEVDGGANT